MTYKKVVDGSGRAWCNDRMGMPWFHSDVCNRLANPRPHFSNRAEASQSLYDACVMNGCSVTARSV